MHARSGLRWLLVLAAFLAGCLPDIPSPEVAVEPGSETAVAYVSSTNGVSPATWVVAYNHGASGRAPAFVDGTPTGAFARSGWAFSIDDGATWTRRTAWSPGSGGPSGTAPQGIVPPAPGQGIDNLGRPIWAGDPAIAASPDGTVVALANMAPAKPGGTAQYIVVSLSYDGGRTFTQSYIVNDTGCSNGAQDRRASPSIRRVICRAGSFPSCGLRSGTTASTTL